MKNIIKYHLKFLIPFIIYSTLTSLSALADETQLKADLIYHHGKIYTVDNQRSWAQAIAIKQGKFIYVGDNSGVQKYIGSTTKVVDLDNGFVMPSLTDIHVHPLESEENELYGCMFDGYAPFKTILKKITQCVNDENSDMIISGGAWSNEMLLNLQGKTIRARLDEISKDKAIILHDEALHSVIANSKAIKLANITNKTPNPNGGTIVRDPKNGEATGLFIEAASNAFYNIIPKRTLAQRLAAVKSVSHRMNSYGITAWKDASVDDEMLKIYYLADKAGGLTANVAASILHKKHSIADLIKLREEFSSEHLNASFVKMFIDGIPPVKTAFMVSPYAKDDIHGEQWFGDTFYNKAELNQALINFDKAGFMVKAHVTGDGAVRMFLDAVKAARNANGLSGPRHEAAHASYIDPADIPRFKALNVAADLSPILWHPSPFIDLMVDAIGERGKEFWPIKDLHNTGAFLVSGSDWAAVVVTPSPWTGMEAMITRAHPENTFPGTLWKEQAIDLATVIDIYTRNGSEAMLINDKTGSIELGKSADFIVLNHNLFNITSDKISETKILETIFEGKSVYINKANHNKN